jgi:hypothetical protein
VSEGWIDAIPWGFAVYDGDGKFYWCTEEQGLYNNTSVTYEVPVPVAADKAMLGEPFLLVSPVDETPVLQIAKLDLSTFRILSFFCLHHEEELRQTAIALSKLKSLRSPLDEFAAFQSAIDEYQN